MLRGKRVDIEPNPRQLKLRLPAFIFSIESDGHNLADLFPMLFPIVWYFWGLNSGIPPFTPRYACPCAYTTSQNSSTMVYKVVVVAEGWVHEKGMEDAGVLRA